MELEVELESLKQSGNKFGIALHFIALCTPIPKDLAGIIGEYVWHRKHPYRFIAAPSLHYVGWRTDLCCGVYIFNKHNRHIDYKFLINSRFLAKWSTPDGHDLDADNIHRIIGKTEQVFIEIPYCRHGFMLFGFLQECARACRQNRTHRFVRNADLPELGVWFADGFDYDSKQRRVIICWGRNEVSIEIAVVDRIISELKGVKQFFGQWGALERQYIRSLKKVQKRVDFFTNVDSTRLNVSGFDTSRL
jgi:hypothetical protein